MANLFIDSPHAPEAQQHLNDYYASCGVLNSSDLDKISALEKTIGDRDFFAFGGEETDLMKLRASELVFLEETNGV